MTNNRQLAHMESGPQSAPTEVVVSESDGPGVAEHFFNGKNGATGDSNLVPASNERKDRNLLQLLAADLYALLKLHLQYKVYEWTLDGRSWFVHRSLFVDLGGAVSNSIDLVAERIVALGGSPAANTGGKIHEVQQRISSAVHDSPHGMLLTVHQEESEMIEQLEHQIRLARVNKDYLTSEVLTHLRTKHARHVDELASAYRRAAGSAPRSGSKRHSH